MAGGHCVYNPEPLADFVDVFVLGDGEEVVGEINEVDGRLAEDVAPRARDRAGLLLAVGGARGGVRARRSTAATYEDGRLVSTPFPRPPVCPSEVTKRTVGNLAEWPYPARAARAADRSGPRPAQRRGVPRLHPGGAASARRA